MIASEAFPPETATAAPSGVPPSEKVTVPASASGPETVAFSMTLSPEVTEVAEAPTAVLLDALFTVTFTVVLRAL